jgi:hypothetical protein
LLLSSSTLTVYFELCFFFTLAALFSFVKIRPSSSLFGSPSQSLEIKDSLFPIPLITGAAISGVSSFDVRAALFSLSCA